MKLKKLVNQIQERIQDSQNFQDRNFLDIGPPVEAGN